MDINNYITKTRKGQHLTIEERVEIQIRLKDGWNINQIAKSLGRAYNTIKSEIKRGTVLLYNGKVERYKAKIGQTNYEGNRKNSRRKYKLLEENKFIKYVSDKYYNEKWSIDQIVGYVKRKRLFLESEIVCTKTIYNYIDKGLIGIKNIELPEKLKRKNKKKREKENKRRFGKSIDERPEIVEKREEFGHWEIDSVICKKDKKEPVVVTLLERKTRMYICLKVKDHTSKSLMESIKEEFKNYETNLNKVFKTITADNGTEFAELNELSKEGIEIYFTHPYSSYEKGSNEVHNRILRRFIPKSKSISDYKAEEIKMIADIINNMPRKILDYNQPEELFDRELDLIYVA